VLGCADTKSGIPSMEALLQHKVREGSIDEIISKVLTLLYVIMLRATQPIETLLNSFTERTWLLF
jgi:hypothetical protein